MSDANRPWPPLIFAEHVPHSVKWRDACLTMIVWALFGVLLVKELEPSWSANWALYVERLTLYMLLAAGLGGMLIAFSLRTLRRLERALHLPQPAPLEAASEARRAGLDEAELMAMRERRIVVVHVAADGRGRIESKDDADDRRPVPANFPTC
jgi:hypothetical protein